MLGPFLLVLYTAELANVIAAGHGLKMLQYADDNQIYAYTMVNDATSAVDRFATCFTDFRAWLTASKLEI